MPASTRSVAVALGLGLVAPALVLTGTPPASAADPVDIQIVGTNDFHGRLLPDRDIPGAAKYAGAVEALRAENPNTIFAAAGDLIGATTFESFINEDKPTIDVLNAMDLDVSAVGNHELDQGYADLVDRVMAPESEANPHGGAGWQYVAANIEEPAGADEIAESWTTEVNGVTVGFVGAVTEDLPSLVSPDGIAGLTVTDIVDATNAEAAALTAAGADVVVMLVHEGAPDNDCVDPAGSAWGSVVNGVSADVDAIVSGHTHLNYSCQYPVPEWGTRTRPVVSAGQYGAFLNRLTFSVDPESGSILSVTNQNVNINAGAYQPDPEVAAIVEEAKKAAEVPGSVELGQIAGAFNRPAPVAGSTENNRGAESTLSNFVAEVQRWATRTDERGGAQIAFMNPGGLRTDLTDTAGDGFPEAVTYREAADVQPFANTLVNLRMTGAQIKTVLEQQWQRDAAGRVPTRPFLRLGTSEGFEFTYDPTRPEGDRITGMYLHDQALDPGASYSVTANSFLASGGDNFRGFAAAGQKRDTGVSDLQAMVDYMARFAADAPLAPSYAQHAVGVHLPGGHTVARGGQVRLELSSLVMTGAGDVQDKTVRIFLGDKSRGQVPVDATPSTLPFDEAGTATAVLDIPGRARTGQQFLRVVGEQTGTEITVPIRITS
ncbi:MAG TPA: bifunctional UDP-sugar hydrolase/5'-nucleotidase [Nocardioides sp.]|nr:bifunctional UDP-sugar hydrolase/5'-nucleotidase [Nocardioides sp.]